MFAVLILFGGQRLPELAKGLGRSIREFKRASAGVEQEIKRAIETAPEPAARRPAVQETDHTSATPQPLPPAPAATETPVPPFDGPATPRT